MNKLNEFYCVDYEISQITSKNTATERTNILNQFATNSKIQLLFSVRILDECIDIASCDSIYITYPSKSKIRTIQRLCRCIRIDKNNKFKIGNIYIWCSEYDDILETLSGIKEYDLFFKDKIMINETNYYNDSDKEKLIIDKKLVEKYIVGIKEFKQLTWTDKLKLVEDYIIEYSKRPSNSDKNKEIKQLGNWLLYQQTNYKNNKKIRKYYEAFIEKYKEYFISNHEKWYNKLKKLEEYIIENNKRPSKIDKNEEIKYLGVWLGTQIQNYKNNKYIMQDENIIKEYEAFIKKYKKYFLSNEQELYYKLKLVEDYIIANNKTPSQHDKNKDIKQLGQWLGTQQKNYKNNKQSMKNDTIRKEYESFIEKYKEYFK